jgi:predicted phosphoribosyltransferase
MLASSSVHEDGPCSCRRCPDSSRAWLSACAAAVLIRRTDGVLVARKVGTHGQEKLALGAVADGEAVYVNEAPINELGVPATIIEEIPAREMGEVERRTARYRGDRRLPALQGRSVILVDDGAATGATAEVAIRALRGQRHAEIVMALPVAAGHRCERLRAVADRLVCLRSPELFFAIGEWYAEFSHVSSNRGAGSAPAGRGLCRRGQDGADADFAVIRLTLPRAVVDNADPDGRLAQLVRALA